MSLVHKVVVKESPPTPSDDISKGYGVGFKWVDTIEKKAYMTFDCSEGNAVWIEITLSDKMPEGEFKGSWVEGNKRKKFKKRKVSVKFDTFPTAKPS